MAWGRMIKAHRTSPVAGLLAAALLIAGTAVAQEPSTPPPPAGGSGQAGSRYHELLPDIGLIGAQVGAAAGWSHNPYGIGSGWELGAFIDLPLARHGSSRLSYEIWMSLSGGSASSERLRLLDVSPFALKYTFTRFDGVRLRPYLTAGVDVTLAVMDFPGRPFPDFDIRDAPPSGFGRTTSASDTTLGLGAHAGGGVELRVSRGFSLNLDYRYTRAEADQSLHSATAVFGFHW
jgi:opacity protein-like surface antigen